MLLKDIWQKLKDEEFEAYIVTRGNKFIGEDILDEENKILELTGFSGSAATLLITRKACYLFVDGRYQIQARKETNPAEVTVIDTTGSTLESVMEICEREKISRLTYNPWCLSIHDIRQLQSRKICLLGRTDFLPQDVSPQATECFRHEYSGKSAEDKCKEVASLLPESVDAFLICAADQVSWLANLRSKTLPETPILRAYALLDRNGKLCIFADNCTNPEIRPFSALFETLEKYKGKTIAADFNITPQIILSSLPEEVKLVSLKANPLTQIKSAKNEVELAGFKKAHIRDGIAVTKFLCWLDANFQKLTELDVVKKLNDFRAQQPLFVSESFATIAAAGANAAIVHYQPSAATNTALAGQPVLLLDSGGQYLDGTTDVTRTVALCQPSEEIKESFTQVLKAHIALAMAKFPDGTSGCALDTISRSIMWRFAKDYNHGTGHSVGHFSNVHEAPFGISPRNRTPIHQNYITSNEPGYYKEGCYGIRIENLVYCRTTDTAGFLGFENLTLIPIDKRLINPYLLDNGERVWLNNYHRQVWGCLAPHMDTEEKKWLETACSPI